MHSVPDNGSTFVFALTAPKARQSVEGVDQGEEAPETPDETGI